MKNSKTVFEIFLDSTALTVKKSFDNYFRILHGIVFQILKNVNELFEKFCPNQKSMTVKERLNEQLLPCRSTKFCLIFLKLCIIPDTYSKKVSEQFYTVENVVGRKVYY